MPRIPIFTAQGNVARYNPPMQDPAAMAAPSRALEQASGQVAAVAEDFLKKYEDAKRQADASMAIAEGSRALYDLDNTFSKGDDSTTAQKGFDTAAQKAIDDRVNAQQDPRVQALVRDRLTEQSITHSQSVYRNAFGNEVDKRQGEYFLNMESFRHQAAEGQTPQIREQAVKNAEAATAGYVAGGWVKPEVGAKSMVKFYSDLAETAVRKDLNAAAGNAPALNGLSARLSDPTYAKGLDPEARQRLIGQVDNMADRQIRADAAAMEHADVLAQRRLNNAQAQNIANLIARTHAGERFTPAQIEEWAVTQKIDSAGVNALYAAMNQEESGHDKQGPAGQHWQQVFEGNAKPADVMAWRANGDISTDTQKSMLQNLAATLDKQQNAVEQNARAQLRTALSANAVEQGLIPDPRLKSMMTTLWGQALDEWSQRVITGHENPNVALKDMLPKYTASLNISAPSWLARPRYGVIGSQDDLRAVTQKTVQAYESKTIDEATYQREYDLLGLYASFFAMQAAAQGAAAAPTAPARTAPTGGGTK